MKPKRYLVTGCYGFLGFHVTKKLLEAGHVVAGADRLKGAQSQKAARVRMLAKCKGFEYYETPLHQPEQVKELFNVSKPDEVMHFAAQYSIKYSYDAARSYFLNNYLAFGYLLREAHERGLKRFNYASSTFVEDGALPTSIYGASKRANEELAHVYSCMGMQAVGIRYGSTFGPWCRQDVAIHHIARKILKGTPIHVTPGSAFHYQTAFLDIDDAAAATLALLNWKPTERHNVFTLVARDHRHDIGQVVRLLEKALGIKAKCDWAGYVEKGPGGIPEAQCNKLRDACGYEMRYSVEQAVAKFAAWIKEHEQCN